MEVLDYGGVGLWRHWIMEVLDYGGVGLWRCWIMEVLDYGGVGLWRCWIMEALDYGGIGLYCACTQVEHLKQNSQEPMNDPTKHPSGNTDTKKPWNEKRTRITSS